MKRKSILFWLLASVACFAQANPIGPAQAIKIAADYLPNGTSEARIRPMRRTMTRGLSVADTLAPLYIISRGEDMGFVIVSGDDCMPGIIGYTDHGDFAEDDMPPALLDMLEGYAELIEKAQAENAPTRAPRKVVAGRKSIGPIIQAHWHQSAPYNNLAPFITNTSNRALTGCTCTAAVMVLHYFRRDLPGELLATTPTYGYGDAPVTVSYPKGTPILWDLMQYSYNGTYPEEMLNAVAVLNAAFGAGIWQTYGSSTSGQISNIVDGYNNYFNLGSACLYKGGTNQTTWETMVYNNLVNKQPMVYAGVHPSNGGHAIILDGYNATNGLFHFNFGWGGQGDGYYTLDDETGVNGFSGQQGMVYNIAPKRPKITASLDIEPHAYKRMETEIKVKATNEGTLDYSGFNLYWSTTKRTPTSSTKVSAQNTTLILGSDESGEFSATFKPAMERTYYIYLTDKNCNILDQAELEVCPMEPKLTLRSFDISTGGSSEAHTSGNYCLLYNDKVNVKISITNGHDATPSQATIRLGLMQYEESSNSLETKETLNISGNTFYPGEETELTYTIEDLDAGQRYALCVYSELGNSNSGDKLQAGNIDTLIHFKSCSPTLECIGTKEHTITLAGDWDPLRFEQLAADTVYTCYDLTQVSGINSQPKAANPNALFYTKSDVEGYNIIHGDHCKELHLQPGYDFKPNGAFTAQRATFNPQWEVNRWYTFSIPFTAIKPEGYICRTINEITATAVTKVGTTDTLYAGTPYMMMACDNRPIIGENVTIEVSDTMTTALSCFQAVTTSMTADEHTLAYSHNPQSSMQYFVLVDSGTRLAPFTAIIKSSSRRIRSFFSTTDKNYGKLAQAIQEAKAIYNDINQQIVEEWNKTMLASISQACRLFSDAQSGASEIDAYTAELLSLINEYKLMVAQVESPICYSSMITNPSFESGSKEGWVSDNRSQTRPSSYLNTYGVGMDGNYLLYSETAEGGGNISQTIHNLRSGYYRLTAMIGTGEEGSTTLFAGDSLCDVAPHQWGRFYLDEYVIDSIWVDTDSLTIGIEGGHSWYKADNFNLYYLGTGRSVESDIAPLAIEGKKTTIYSGIFDLLGRRITRKDMIPGHIYIIDGRKVIYRNKQ